MKVLTCKSLGQETCSFEAHGENNEEVKAKMTEHASQAHPEVLKDITPEKQAKMNDHMESVVTES